MVQIGVSILSADPSKSDVAPAREWAMKLVEQHSGLPFSDKDRGRLGAGELYQWDGGALGRLPAR
jgi:hypothetical protein